MTHAAPIIVLPTPTLIPAVCRDMVELAADLIRQPAVSAEQIQGIAKALSHWSDLTQGCGRVSAEIAITARRLMQLSRLGYAEIGDLARWLLRQVAALRQMGGAA